MCRRLANLLVAATFALATAGACPRGGDCPTMQRAAHRCCDTGSEALRVFDCCAGGLPQVDRAPAAERTELSARAAVLIGGMNESPAPRRFAFGCFRVARGLAPPGSLVGQHTSLLL